MSGEVWEIEYQGRDRLVAREWPWRINCQTRPARIEIRVVSAAEGATALKLEASAPGFGPIATRHLTDHLRALEEKIAGIRHLGQPSESIRGIAGQMGR
jgi:hypothetical protein